MLDDEMYQKLVSITDEKKITVSEFIRGLVLSHLTENTDKLNNIGGLSNEVDKNRFWNSQRKNSA
jgi:hypothetical protein